MNNLIFIYRNLFLKDLNYIKDNYKTITLRILRHNLNIILYLNNNHFSFLNYFKSIDFEIIFIYE